MTIVGSDPVGKDNSQGGEGPEGYANTPGPHRYIGIGMVVGMVFVIFILWLLFGRWPRRKLREWGWLKTKPESEESGTMEKPRVVDEIVLPKEPEKVKTRKGSEHMGRRHAVASWEAEIDYRISWERKQDEQYEVRKLFSSVLWTVVIMMRHSPAEWSSHLIGRITCPQSDGRDAHGHRKEPVSANPDELWPGVQLLQVETKLNDEHRPWLEIKHCSTLLILYNIVHRTLNTEGRLEWNMS